MSAKRLNKRQLREQQELEELAQAQAQQARALQADDDQGGDAPTTQQEDHADEHGDEQPQSDDITSTQATKKKKKKDKKAKQPPTSIFAALGADEDAGDDAEQDEDQEEDNEDEQGVSMCQTEKTAPKKRKNKKKKSKKATVAGNGGDEEEAADAAGATGKAAPIHRQKASKKGASGGAAGSGKDVDDMSMDELDALLESQAKLAAAQQQQQQQQQSDGKAGSTASLRPTSVSSFRTHLSLDPRSLDPTIELRRQFGSAAIKAFESEAAAGGASAGARARAQATNSNLKLRSHLCQPQAHWPPIGRTFTGMQMDVRDTRSGRVCSWQHGKAYKQVQLQFLQAVKSYDPNSLMALLRVYPWHIDTLLQLSDYSRHQGDLGQAADFNSRALFAFERTANPYFVSCLSSSTSGPPLVNFLNIENRAFYLAVHRNLGFLGRRGTWRTALEWSKILLGLGKDGEDHHAALLWIDFLAIKAKQGRWLVELCDKLDLQRGQQRNGGGVKRVEEISVRAETCIDDEKRDAGEGDGYEGTLDWCVGLQYARALAFKAIEREEKDKSRRRSTAALRLAIARYPMAVPLLANKIGIDLPGNVATHPLFQLRTRYDEGGDGGDGDSLPHLLSQIYAIHSESLWKEPGYAEWLRDTTVALFPTLSGKYEAKRGSKRREAVADQKTRQGIYRHVLVSDLPDNMRQGLVAYLPPEVTRNSEMMDAFDPVPPVSRELYGQGGGSEAADDEKGRATRYDDEYFAPIMANVRGERGAGWRGGGGGGERGEAGEGGEAGLMQAFMRAMQGVGGMRGWNEAMQNMDDETREDVMAQILEMTAQTRRERGADTEEAPGGFGAVEGGEEHAEAAPEREGAFAALRNALNAVWGAGGTAHLPADENEDEEGGGMRMRMGSRRKMTRRSRSREAGGWLDSMRCIEIRYQRWSKDDEGKNGRVVRSDRI